uniref:Olfactory receptor family 9 subfamily G member 1 n=1 Tax=Anolis carolinensis TaxID=28377 RepID=A0A803TXZ1_ANOCA
MEERNRTAGTDFILLGFTTNPKLQLILFVVFLNIYLLSLVGNITLIALICNSSRLHTPMYFFIGNLSFLDLWYSSVYTPKIIMNCISDDKSISFGGCACPSSSSQLAPHIANATFLQLWHMTVI